MSAMPDRVAQHIVTQALELAAGGMAPLDALDAVMQGLRGCDPDFQSKRSPFGNHIDERSAFGKLLREAFAPQLDPSRVTPDELLLRFQGEVVEPFADRYGLWP